MTGVAIISRGTYIPPGKKPEAGEVKLYLFIEGPSDLQVKQGKLELQRLLDEEAMKLGSQMGGGGSSYGRYSVL
jgi:ATP-dependent RNA helicase DDX46/PRP5